MKPQHLFFIIMLFFNLLYADTSILIPSPTTYQAKRGHFTITEKSAIQTDTQDSNSAIHYLQSHLKTNAHYTLKSASQLTNIISYHLNTNLPNEAYTLDIQTHNIQIEAGSNSGFFYATITLMQLMDPKIWSSDYNLPPQKHWSIANCRVTDAPRFVWRGMMLDSARNFFAVGYVKKFIDRMAQYKLNRFHWHLSDDEGWRIEIKKYPLLTEVGAVRGPDTALPFTLFPTMRGPKNKVQKGYYTQEEIKDIVAYAAERHIQILPEIDLPAHSKAAVVAYPNLLLDPQDNSHFFSVQKIENNTINPALESSYIFIDALIKELTQLFPYPYIHLGGDEVPKGAWSGSPAVQRLMKQKGFKDQSDVQAYFLNRVDKLLRMNHRTLIAWQEAAQHGAHLRDGTVFMAWKGTEQTRRLLKKGHRTIATPAQYLYFDQQYLKKRDEPGHTWAGAISTKKVYGYQPLHSKISLKDKKKFQGVQACLWSERAYDEKTADYLVWPRALAFSQIAWSQVKSKNWKQFKKRLSTQTLKKLDVQNIHYRPLNQ